MKTGNCRICGEYGELSFEHVPPRITYNKTTRYKIIPYLDYLKRSDPFDTTSKSKIEQGGIGFYSLCKKCNSFLGSNYVTIYDKYVKTMAYVARRNSNNYFVFQIHDLEALRVLKQIVAMFLSINDWAFSQANPELIKFVQVPKQNNLPDRYRFFNYLNTEGQFRHLPLSIKGNFLTGVSIPCSEIAFPPLGYVMTVDYTGEVNGLTEITGYKNVELNKAIEVELAMFRLPTIFPIPLDYRDKQTIDKDMKQGK